MDDGWKVVDAEPELEPVVQIHANNANGNGHGLAAFGDDGDDMVNGNGHRRNPTEGQQPLFSWAEFSWPRNR